MQTSGCLPAWLRWRTSDVRWLGLLPHCAPACARGGTSFVLGVARHCAHGADLCRGASRHHGARRLAQAARVKDAYGGHGVGVEQNGRPEHGRSVLLQLYRTGEAKWEKPLLFEGKDVEDFAGQLEEMQTKQ